MRKRTPRLAALAVCVSTLVIACSREGGETAGSTTGATTQAGATAAATTGMSDGNIVALFDEVNVADSSLAEIARTKATRSDVRQFAQLMISEHHALREKGLELARRPTGALPPWPKAEPPAVDPFKPAVDNATNALNSTPKGAAFDSTYVANEVAIHQAVLDWATNAAAQTQHQELKGLLTSTAPVIRKHLDQARSIQGKLGAPTRTKTP